MLHPSYSELMEVVNSEVEEGEQMIVQSRYSIVKATATRAKEIIDARYLEEKYDKLITSDKDGRIIQPKMTEEEQKKQALGQELIPGMEDAKPLSVAVKELYEGKIKIIADSSFNDQEEEM